MAEGRGGEVTTDRVTVQRRRVGSFDRFYADHFDRTHAVVLALRGPRASAEEVTQEAFERALRRWETVAALNRPDLWVQRVALNLATSRLRRVAAEARAVARLAARRPVAVTAGYEEAERFWSLVRKLADRQGQVVALFYAADLSVAEIAETLEMAEGTVKSHLHAARKRLTELLELEGDTDV